MSFVDILIFGAYLVGILLLGTLAGKKNSSGEEYFSGGRSMPWYAIGLSVGLTMISANSFIGGPGWAYHDGLVAAMVNFSVPLTILFCTYTILPIIYHTRVVTVYEYSYLRFGNMTRMFNVVIWLVQSLIFVGGFVYTPSLVLEAITGISLNIWVPVIVLLAIIYTVAGGIKAVIWTDMIQGIILFVGLVLSIFVATGKLGMPIGEAMAAARDAGLTASFDFSFAPGKLTIWCAIIAGFLYWVGYFGFDQGQVQRYVTAKDVRTIKKTGVLSSIAMQCIYWFCFLLGIILFVFYKTNANTLDFANSNNIMTDFLVNYCPHGLLGVLLAATFAAAMSSIDSVLNSVTAVFVRDIYEPYISKKPGQTPLSKSIMFSCIASVLVVFFVYWYLSGSTGSVLMVVGEVTQFTSGLLSAILIISLFMPKVTDKACFFGSVLALVCSIAIKNIINPQWYYLWDCVYCIALCIFFSWILSFVFKDEEATKRAYRYTLKGSIAELKGQTDSTGCSIEPLKLDKYAAYILVVFVVQIIILAVLQ